jgi:hypothetical protein
MARDSSAGTIAGRLPRGYAERNLKTGFGIRMGGRDTVPLDGHGSLILYHNENYKIGDYV